MNYMPTHYEILGLPESLQDAPVIPAQTLRGAKRRAMLQNHPDKAENHKLKRTASYSIDQISRAFFVLSNPTTRAKYDKELKLHKTTMNSGKNGPEIFRTGVETVDLDDLDEEEAEGIWYRSCRCGNDRGFLILEADLEEAVDDGELNVGCQDCSLWLKVLFSVADDTG